MPMVGQMGGEFGFSQITDGKEASVGVTYNFPKAFTVAEIAMAEMAGIDFPGNPDYYSTAVNYGVECGVIWVVSNGQVIMANGASITSNPNVTSVSFYATKRGYMSAWFRFLISFWA